MAARPLGARLFQDLIFATFTCPALYSYSSVLVRGSVELG